MKFSGLLFISFLIICDAQFNHLSNDVHLANSIQFQKSSVIPGCSDPPQFLDNQNFLSYVNNTCCILFGILLFFPFSLDPSLNSKFT